MPKFVFMPPQSEQNIEWASKLTTELPAYNVATPETDEEAEEMLKDADAAFGVVPPAALAGATKLKWLQSPAAAPPAGYYYPELIEHEVIVCNPRGVYNDHIAQHILMYMLALARGLPYYMDAQRESRWDKQARKSTYVDLARSSALIFGVGGIGQETAKLCLAFGMRVIGIDERWEHDVPLTEKYQPGALDSLLPEADFVITTVPHTPSTEGMWNSSRFGLMKNSAYFINIGRGLTTKIADLTTALESGQIAGCGLDVYETEPFPSHEKLWTMGNVILTPHIAVHEAPGIADRQFGVLLDNARLFAEGRPLRNVVDKSKWY
ncbi:MAG: D-2-hydroxyacid dehydrogenase [Chloroflexota bacterium]